MPGTKLYNMWSCPFAQRAWIALLHREVDFEYIEHFPYNKSPEWLAINPRGLVPTIVHEGDVVYESPICIEYVDEQWSSSGKPLLPNDAFQRAKVRMWSDHVSKKIVPPFYTLLLKQSKDERDVAKREILDNVEVLSKAMSDDGPFFMGAEFGMVDAMLAPFAERFAKVTSHSRGFQIPDEQRFRRYHTWWKAVQEVSSVAATLQDTQKLNGHYAKYADDTAKSEVATAIRVGKVLP